MSSEVALEGDDVGPPGVDEPAPPGMEEEEAPPGVEAEKTETKTEASTAAAVTDSTGPVSSEALAYGGYGSYGAYDPAGYGYDPNLWNYYSTGSYFPGAYPGAPSAGKALPVAVSVLFSVKFDLGCCIRGIGGLQPRSSAWKAECWSLICRGVHIKVSLLALVACRAAGEVELTSFGRNSLMLGI